MSSVMDWTVDQLATFTPSKGIKPIDKAGAYRTGTLTATSYEQICQVLGFPPNVEDDPDKVKYSWGFSVDGVECAIWDYYSSYKQNVWSLYGPKDVLKKLFGNNVE